MEVSSTSERVSDADIFQAIKVIDIDSHLSEPLDLWTSRRIVRIDGRIAIR